MKLLKEKNNKQARKAAYWDQHLEITLQSEQQMLAFNKIKKIIMKF